MNLNALKLLRSSALAGAALLVAACSSGGDDGAVLGSPNTVQTGTLSVAITDAPVDDVAEVVIEFDGATIRDADGNDIEIAFDAPKSIDLLTLTGGTTEALVDNEVLPAGAYESIRLAVNAEFDGVLDSYVILDDGSQFELRVPSGAQSGLKINSDFTIAAGGATAFVVDWDVRQSLTNPVGQPGLFLRPVLRITDLTEYGTLTGAVDGELVSDDSCTGDLVEDTGNAVYVFAGVGVAVDDIDDVEPNPIATGAVTQQDNGSYAYTVDFLPPGDYVAAFTCQAADDDPETDDQIVFALSEPVSIVDDETTVLNFRTVVTQ